MFAKRFPRKISSSVKRENKVYKICLTGGPCSGKTTSINYIRERFSPNFIVYAVPELATQLANSGINIIPKFFTAEDHEYFTVSFSTNNSKR